jgi:hypothetical protein
VGERGVDVGERERERERGGGNGKIGYRECAHVLRKCVHS